MFGKYIQINYDGRDLVFPCATEEEIKDYYDAHSQEYAAHPGLDPLMFYIDPKVAHFDKAVVQLGRPFDKDFNFKSLSMEDLLALDLNKDLSSDIQNGFWLGNRAGIISILSLVTFYFGNRELVEDFGDKILKLVSVLDEQSKIYARHFQILLGRSDLELKYLKVLIINVHFMYGHIYQLEDNSCETINDRRRLSKMLKEINKLIPNLNNVIKHWSFKQLFNDYVEKMLTLEPGIRPFYLGKDTDNINNTEYYLLNLIKAVKKRRRVIIKLLPTIKTIGKNLYRHREFQLSPDIVGEIISYLFEEKISLSLRKFLTDYGMGEVYPGNLDKDQFLKLLSVHY